MQTTVFFCLLSRYYDVYIVYTLKYCVNIHVSGTDHHLLGFNFTLIPKTQDSALVHLLMIWSFWSLGLLLQNKQKQITWVFGCIEIPSAVTGCLGNFDLLHNMLTYLYFSKQYLKSLSSTGSMHPLELVQSNKI